jgi:hypothetical protein
MCGLVMDGGMMFDHIVAIVFFARGPVVSELSAKKSVAEPMVFHVHQF